MKENDDKYRLIAQSTSDLICTTTFDLNPVYTYVSPSYKYILGYAPEDLISKSVWDYIHPDDRIGLLPMLKKYIHMLGENIISGADHRRFENLNLRIKDKEGNWHYLQCTANIIGRELLFVSKDVTEQKMVENKLKENERLLSLILQSSGDGILVGLKNGSFIYANDRFKGMWHIPDDVIRRKNREKLHEAVAHQLKDAQGFFKRLSELYESEEECFDTVEFKDGRIFEHYSVPLNKDDKLWGRVWSFRDVTQRHDAEVRIEKEREFEKMLLDSLPHPIMIINQKRKVIAANKVALDVGAKIGCYCWKEFGKTEFISESDRERLARGETEGIKCTFCLADEALAGKTTTNDPNVYAFGRYWDVYWKFIIKDDKGDDLYLHYAVDITERRKIEEAIRKAAEDWSKTFDAIDDGIFLQDINHTIIKANRSFCEMVKLNLKDVIGKKCYRLLHGTDTPWPDCPFEETRKDNKTHTRQINDPHIGIPLLVTTSPTFNDKGELTGSVHVTKDISQIKKTEEELKDKIHDLEIFNSAAVGREMKMIELKKKIKELEDKLNKSQD